MTASGPVLVTVTVSGNAAPPGNSGSPPPEIWTEISPCAPPIVAVPVTVTEVGVVDGGGATEVGAAAVVDDAVAVGATG
ncbi:hypothetical protein MINS_22070 [Mycolicibacterium insubricum]|nr:hypothetical protein MINS_22070 [Mycolicibacterium insubricum]